MSTKRKKKRENIFSLSFLSLSLSLSFSLVMLSDHEYEVTCGIVFDGEIYGRLKSELYVKSEKPPIEEDIDIYGLPGKEGERYRALTRYAAVGCDGAAAATAPAAAAIDDVEIDYRRFDHKKTIHAYESQIPYVERSRGRLLFITCTYKESMETILDKDEWDRTVKEDHTSGDCMRVYNKKRLCFYEGAFRTSVPYTRVSIGQQSSYGGTLEARSVCNAIYYFEIELESTRRLGTTEVDAYMHQICDMVFQLLPYDLVKSAMLARNTRSVQRERIDGVFDTFTRQFRDYTSCAPHLRRLHKAIAFYIMPKWDGIRAVGLYFCDGYLIVKDACGRISSFRTVLPFDNDMILQLEVVRPKSVSCADITTDSEGCYYVITELLAVFVKSPNTLYHVYGRNNGMYDTGRNIGNVVPSITIKTQFKNASHVCNLYRLLKPETSLRAIATLTEIRDAGADGPCYHVINITSVVNITDRLMSVKDFLDCMDDATTNGKIPGLRTKEQVLRLFADLMPVYLQNDLRFKDNCEGMIVAFTKRGGENTHRSDLEEYSYFKLKHIDTVDLELNLITGTLTSSDQTHYRAEGLPNLDNVLGWAERPTPIKNQRIIVECYYDGNKLLFFKDRCDKSRPDSDRKIKATNGLIFDNCRVLG
jgi:hypothetical protein